MKFEKFEEKENEKRMAFIQVKATEMESLIDAALIISGTRQITLKIEFDEKILQEIHQELEKRYKAAGWIGVNLNFNVGKTEFSLTVIGK